MQAVDKEGDPADARLQKGNSQPGMTVKDTARDQRGHRRHLVEREADAVHLDVVGEAVHADFGQVHTGGAVNSQRHPLLDGGGVERIQVSMVKVRDLSAGGTNVATSPSSLASFMMSMATCPCSMGVTPTPRSRPFVGAQKSAIHSL